MNVINIQVQDKDKNNIYHFETNTDVIKHKDSNLGLKIEEISKNIESKVDKITGKGLSANDFTDTYKNNLIDCNNNKHSHNNKSVLDKITQTVLDNLNGVSSHISDTIKHITSDERTLWNTVSNKADKTHTHDDRYYTETEMDGKVSTLNTSIGEKVSPTGTIVANRVAVFNDTTGKVIKDSGFTIATSVPSGAKFTDTNTWRGVQDNLTSTATDQSLSANQGKILKGLIDGKANSSHTHNYAGSSSAGGSANTALACTGNSATATKLQTARKITLTGNITGSASFDGSGDVSIATSGISAIPTSTISALF